MADRTARFSNWFQIISNVAIIVGLGLVIYELNQSKQFIHAQLGNEQMTRLSDRQLTMMGEDPRDALARAALDPSNLDEKDAVTLDALYTDVLNGWSILRFNSETIGADNGWRFVVANEARIYFSSDPGRRWLNAWAEEDAERTGMGKFATLALDAVRNEPVDFLRSKYELLMAKEQP
jgi:hypothetical protein